MYLLPCMLELNRLHKTLLSSLNCRFNWLISNCVYSCTIRGPGCRRRLFRGECLFWGLVESEAEGRQGQEAAWWTGCYNLDALDSRSYAMTFRGKRDKGSVRHSN